MTQAYDLPIREFPMGTHACLVYSTPEERAKAVVPFLMDGLEAGHRCLFLGGDRVGGQVAEALRAEGVDLEAAREAGRLLFESERDSYRRHGNFAPHEMLTMLVDGSDAAAADGFEGLRASGEMTWPVDDLGTTEGLMEYEARVNHVMTDHPVMALCLYDRTRFPPEVIIDVLRAHPVAMVDGQVYRNLFYERPEAILEGVSAEEHLDWMLAQLEASRQDALRAVRLEAQLRQAQKMDAMGRLSTGVAHDFNNLLTAISGYASLLGEDLEPGSPKTEMIEGITEAAERGAELTAKLLAFGRDHGRREEPVDVAAVVRDLSGMLNRLIPESMILQLDIEDGLPAAWGDSNGLELVVLNLVVNARDACDSHGTIAITADRGHASDGSPGVVITVADDGCGIPEDVQDRIFEPFYTSKPAGEGTGLGLATAYGIVQQAGGEITVESEPGTGSAFHVFLPLAESHDLDTADDDTAPAVAPEPAPTPPDAGLILVIDDEDAVLDLLERILSRQGHRVITAATRDEALALVRTSADELALVISDIRLEAADGIELVDEIRALRPGLPALMISGDTSGARVQDVPNADLLEKPFSPEQLSERVDHALGRA